MRFGKADRPRKARPFPADRDFQDGIGLDEGASAGGQLLTQRRNCTAEAIVEAPVSGNLQADDTIRRREPDARILHRKIDRRQRQAALAAARGQQPINRAERELAVGQLCAEPDMPRAHPGDIGSGQPDRGIGLDPIGHEIGISRVADHHIG